MYKSQVIFALYSYLDKVDSIGHLFMTRCKAIAFALADVRFMVVACKLGVNISDMCCVEEVTEFGMKFFQLFGMFYQMHCDLFWAKLRRVAKDKLNRRCPAK